jgi:hypothetical protein
MRHQSRKDAAFIGIGRGINMERMSNLSINLDRMSHQSGKDEPTIRKG